MHESHQEKEARALATYLSLARAVYSLDGLLNRQCENFGLSKSQFLVLDHLLAFGPMTTGDLAAKVMFGDSTISVVTRNLERSGLLVRRAHGTDGRKVIVHLTAKGEQLVRTIVPQRTRVLRAKMCVLGKREQESLERLCRKLAEGDAARFVLEMTMVEVEEA